MMLQLDSAIATLTTSRAASAAATLQCRYLNALQSNGVSLGAQPDLPAKVTQPQPACSSQLSQDVTALEHRCSQTSPAATRPWHNTWIRLLPFFCLCSALGPLRAASRARDMS